MNFFAPLFEKIATNPILPQSWRDAADSTAKQFAAARPDITKSPQLEYGKGVFQSLPGLPTLTPLPALPKISDLFGDSARFAAMTTAAMKGLPALPDGLNFGGVASVASGKSGVEATLERIERNTKDTADAVSLRRQALGGGELAQLGVTPAEIRGNRGNPGSPTTRGSIGLDTSMSGLTRSLEYITNRKVQESMNRPGFGKFRPRTG